MKKLLYFIPAIPMTILWIFFTIGNSVEVTAIAWILDILFILSGVLMCINKWWGCFLGIISGAILIGMGLQETGQIFKEYLLGFPLVVYYIICGYYVAKRSKEE